MVIAVQVHDAKQGWLDLNTRALKPGMSTEECTKAVQEITKIYDGWLVSDKFRDSHLRMTTREM